MSGALEIAGLSFPNNAAMTLDSSSLLGVALNISTDQMTGKRASVSYRSSASSLSRPSMKKTVSYYSHIKFREDSNWPCLDHAPTSNPIPVTMGKRLFSSSRLGKDLLLWQRTKYRDLVLGLHGVKDPEETRRRTIENNTENKLGVWE